MSGDAYKPRILYVEEDQNTFAYIREVLRTAGLSCELVHAHSEATLTAAIKQGRIDLVISDFSLPGMDGWRALELIKEHAPGTPFILFTGTLHESEALASTREGISDFVSKDSIHRLVPAIDRALREAKRQASSILAQKALERSEQQLRLLSRAIKQTPFGILSLDAAGVIEFANDHARLVCGLGEEAEANMRFSDLCSPTNTTPVREEQNESIRQGRSWRGEYLLRRFSGKDIPVRATLHPVKEEDGEIGHYLALVEDITLWKEEQAKQAKLTEQLYQAQKQETIGTLAGGIAHDFNNILAGILGYAELGAQKIAEGTDAADDFENIRQAALRAKHLVAQILTFSRRTTLAPFASIDLSQIVTEAVQLLKAVMPSTIKLEVHLVPGCIFCDPTQIHQLIMNLGSNAIHAMRRTKGELFISIERITEPVFEGERLTELAPTGPWLRLDVKDTGHGMDPATLARIFDPFFTTKDVGEGTGLGLPVVQGIVQSHQGTIRVKSHEGVGTTFSVFLPESTPQEAPKPEELPHSDAKFQKGAGQCIAVVDDEDIILNIAQRLLMRCGYQSVTFEKATDAAEALLANPDSIDAVLTDQTMPQMTGLDLIQTLRERGWMKPAILMTGNPTEIAENITASHGKLVLLDKPFEKDKLAEAVAQCFR